MQNKNDEKCFLRSVFAGIYPIVKDPQLECHYREYASELDMNGIIYSVDVNKIDIRNIKFKYFS